MRTLRLFQGATLLLLAVCVGLLRVLLSDPEVPAAASPAAAVPDRPAQAPPETLQVIDMAARLKKISGTNADAPDLSQTFFSSPAATVHMHVMGPGQICPLHIHRKGDEVTVIVGGAADVTQIHGPDLARETGVVTAGGAVASPRLCGHEFVNTSGTEALGNLVFSLPPFDYNLYVRPDDARQRQGGAPLRVDLPAELTTFRQGTEPHRLTPLPVMGGRMATLLLRGSYDLEPTGGPVLLYVAAGTVDVRSGDTAGPVTERTLARLTPSGTVHLNAPAGAALLVFQPGA